MARPVRPVHFKKSSVQMTAEQEKAFQAALRDLIFLIAREELDRLRQNKTPNKSAEGANIASSHSTE